MTGRVDKSFLKCYTILVKSLMRADFLHNYLEHTREISHLLEAKFVRKMIITASESVIAKDTVFLR